MVTLSYSWDCGWCAFPAGTVFIPHNQGGYTRGGRTWSYGTPGGGVGEIRLDEGVIPGE